ncbi:hypothetical protein MPER_11363 [Moniliophthora perniciosa FA553]|nr:hypothetical protein MPER_11363 [Moniliophthora perniciosa FA553]
MSPVFQAIDTSKHCGDQDRIEVGQYTLYVHAFGKNQDPQGKSCAEVYSLDGTTASFGNNWQWARADGSVKAFTYLGLNQGLDKQLSAIKDIQVAYHYTFYDNDSGQRGHKKDTFVTFLWLLTTSSAPGGAVANEIRIYLANIHVPVVGTTVATEIKIGDDYSKWDVYKGQRDDGTVVFSFMLRPTQSDYDFTIRDSYDGDINLFLKYLFDNQGLAGDQYLTAIQAGSEAVGGAVNANFTRYSVVVG